MVPSVQDGVLTSTPRIKLGSWAEVHQAQHLLNIFNRRILFSQQLRKPVAFICCWSAKAKQIVPLITNGLLLIYAAHPFTNSSHLLTANVSSLLLRQLVRPECVCSAWGGTVELDGHMAGWRQPLRGAERHNWMADRQTGDSSPGRRASQTHGWDATGRRPTV